MKKLNGDKQAKDVWRLPAVGSWGKDTGANTLLKNHLGFYLVLYYHLPKKAI